MIHVKQRHEFESVELRGDCYTACVASIFEVPYESLPDLNSNRQSSLLHEWLQVNYPGVTISSRDFAPFDAGDPANMERILIEASPATQGYWIANVESPRFQEPCRLHAAPGVESMPPHFYAPDECPFCQGTGTRQGFHAVVCYQRSVVHDPHPLVEGYDWSYNGRLCGATWFTVADPGRLIPRALPSLR